MKLFLEKFDKQVKVLTPRQRYEEVGAQNGEVLTAETVRGTGRAKQTAGQRYYSTLDCKMLD